MVAVVVVLLIHQVAPTVAQAVLVVVELDLIQMVLGMLLLLQILVAALTAVTEIWERKTQAVQE